MQTTRSKLQKRSFREDESAVSPVIGVIMLIAITVVIAAVVAAFAYGIIGGVSSAPSAAIVIENARAGEYDFTVVHHGGDTVTEAFTLVGTPSNVSAWDNIEVKVNGVSVDLINTTPVYHVTLGGNTDLSFSAGEQLDVTYMIDDGGADIATALATGDTITIVYTPTEDVLQRVKVT